MRKVLAESLRQKADAVALQFSRPDRAKNHTVETFAVERITPLSDSTAVVILKKSTGKLAAVFFYYVDAGDPYWQYFFPSDSHILGMGAFADFKKRAEEYNWEHNFTT